MVVVSGCLDAQVALSPMPGKSSTEKSGGGTDRVSYAAAGVDIEAGDRAVDLFKPLAERASRPEVRGGLG